MPFSLLVRTRRGLVVALIAACGGGGAGSVGDAGPDAERDSATDASPLIDAGSDGAMVACPPGVNPALCDTEADCTFVLRGCYCGVQPALGVNKSSATAVAACEAEATKNCALGCPNSPGIQPDEGHVVDASSQVGVRCDTSNGRPGTCFTVAK